MLTYCGVNNLPLLKEIFQIYKHILEQGIYKKSEKEDFHIVLFRNIIVNSYFLDEYDWMENFINKHSAELHSDHRIDMRSYSLAYLNFAKGKFETALEYILEIKYDLFFYKIDVNNFIFKNLF